MRPKRRPANQKRRFAGGKNGTQELPKWIIVFVDSRFLIKAEDEIPALPTPGHAILDLIHYSMRECYLQVVVADVDASAANAFDSRGHCSTEARHSDC
jgi:hypothetical protein